jgi:hypothetical protein
MSALGQKPTYALQQAMSALHPISTAKAKFRKRPCPLYPRKRTLTANLLTFLARGYGDLVRDWRWFLSLSLSCRAPAATFSSQYFLALTSAPQLWLEKVLQISCSDTGI